MLPVVDPKAALDPQYQAFLDQLAGSSFSGDIETQYSSRLAVATDNSVYQQLPQAVVFPKSVADLQALGKLAKQNPEVRFGPRGGGTGTNGQSLTPGLVVDLSRHMNRLLELNVEEGWVRVEAGMVKDQLNDHLRPHGFFFSPDLSTSNRATIGGMINTDASGQGSLVYGKTSDHVLGLRSVLADGTLLDTSPMAMEVAEQQAAGDTRLGELCQQLLASCRDKRQQVLDKFPRLNRFLTGYDLEHALSDDLSLLDISRVITGSEGSLAFVTEAKLNITPIPKHRVLVNIKYDSFESALRHAPVMVAANATSVETVDSKVLNLAKADIVWHSVKELIQEVPGSDVQGLNMVEYASNDIADIEQKLAELKATLDNPEAAKSHGVIGYQLTDQVADINKIYAMRKKAVGLLGKSDSAKKPVAFAEDTAVPPENLADFILEFRALLDSKGLQYGMFGHVDAGVLHVRPALDLIDPEQEILMQEISDQVVALVAKYGGLMWGEHGKGYRSEYAPAFFGEELFAELRKIKRAFDPHNQMNPGKICTPFDSEEELVKVSGVKRGSFDRQIAIEVRQSFEPAMSCNGNGLCYNYDTASPMCPSSKVTRDRRHSPKGRAGMMREWLRLLSQQNVDITALEAGRGQSWWQRFRNGFSADAKSDFSHEVLEVMEGCLACKACANQCPVNVDVPSFRARFLAIYYGRYLRPFKDYLVANVEAMAPRMAKWPRLFNFFAANPLSKALLKSMVGYVDAPTLSTRTLGAHAADAGFVGFDLGKLAKLSPEQKARHLVVVQDPFTSFYEAELVLDFAKLAIKLGYRPVLMPFSPNGKPQHVKGFLDRFTQTAKSSAEKLNQIAALGIPMVGLDPSMVLCYRDEYAKSLGTERGDFNVLLAHEWLEQELSASRIRQQEPQQSDFALFAHCTEKTRLPTSEGQWLAVFEQFGLSLSVVATGCCGMAGTYGHEAQNLDNSKQLFDMGWQPKLADIKPEQVLATGYSCRSQVKRFAGQKIKHPIQALLQSLD